MITTTHASFSTLLFLLVTTSFFCIRSDRNVFLSANVENVPKDVDVVILWVNGSDPEWRRRYFETVKSANKTIPNEFNDLYIEKNELKYCLRSIEAFIPWVRKIHIITDGQVPCWFSYPRNSKVNIVSHEQILGKGNHGFSSIYIQQYIQNIPELAEYFILFDDDYFLMRPLGVYDFFKNGIPIIRATSTSKQKCSIASSRVGCNDD